MCPEIDARAQLVQVNWFLAAFVKRVNISIVNCETQDS